MRIRLADEGSKQAVVEDYPREQFVLGLQFVRVQVHHCRGCQVDVHYPVHLEDRFVNAIVEWERTMVNRFELL